MDTNASRKDVLLERGEICALLREYFSQRVDVAAAYLFGSRARGDARPDSDVDVGIFFREPPRGDPLAGLARRTEITAALEEILPCAVDIVDLDRVSPLVFHVLFEDAQLVYEADPDRRMLAVLRQDKLYQDELGLYLERMSYVRGRLG